MYLQNGNRLTDVEDTPVAAYVPEDRPAEYMEPVGLAEVTGEDVSASFPPKFF